MLYNPTNKSVNLSVCLFSIEDGNLEEELNEGGIPEKLKEIFKNNEIPLSEAATITKEDDGKWRITDKENKKIYVIRKDEGKLNIYSGWTVSSTKYYGGRSFQIENITIPPKNYMTFVPGKQWLHDKDESIILKDAEGNIIDEALNASYGDNNNRYLERFDTDWQFGLQTLDKGGLRKGTVKHVDDGDTILISPVCSKATEFIAYNATQHLIPIPPYSITEEGKIYSSPVGMAGIQSVRLYGIDAPELGTEEGNESKRFLDDLCEKKEVVFDVDDCCQYDKYDRILAMVYVKGTNVNQEMLINDLAIPLIILPSEFVPYANYTYTPLNPVVNQSITFNASSSWTFDPDAAIISYDWSFGDGTNGTGVITNHTYLSPGNYTVSLEVTDSDGKERRCNAVDITLMVYLTEGQPPIAGTPLLRCGC